jgi:hypothetical protein
MGISIMREAHSAKLRLLAPFLPIAMLISVVITANHYTVDTVAGGVVAVIALRFAFMICRFNPIRIQWVVWDAAVVSVLTLSESQLDRSGGSPCHAREARLDLEARIAQHKARAILPTT